MCRASSGALGAEGKRQIVKSLTAATTTMTLQPVPEQRSARSPDEIFLPLVRGNGLDCGLRAGRCTCALSVAGRCIQTAGTSPSNSTAGVQQA